MIIYRRETQCLGKTAGERIRDSRADVEAGTGADGNRDSASACGNG